MSVGLCVYIIFVIFKIQFPKIFHAFDINCIPRPHHVISSAGWERKWILLQIPSPPLTVWAPRRVSHPLNLSYFIFSSIPLWAENRVALSLGFFKVDFIVQNIVCLNECFLYVWKECVCCPGTINSYTDFFHFLVSMWPSDIQQVLSKAFKNMNGWELTSVVKVAQSCPALCNPMDYKVHGILQARILEWVAFPFSRVSSQLRNWTQISPICRQILYQLSNKKGDLYSVITVVVFFLLFLALVLPNFICKLGKNILHQI